MVETKIERRFDVETVRGDFPILHKPLSGGRTLVYLDNAATAQKPRAMIDKLVECYETYNANVHRGIHALGDQVTLELEQSREIVRGYIGARDVEEVIFTSGTTMSINLVAQAWGRRTLNPGDEILLNEMEHHANLVPWQQIAHERQAKLRFVPLTDDGQLDLGAIDGVLTDRTKMVAVTAMSNVLGTINPIAEICRRAHEAGALVLVDAAQSAPHAPFDVAESGADFVAFSGHKLYGPTGIGVLYGKRALLEGMDPFLCGGNMIRRVRRESSDFADLPAKFEAGTPPIAEAIGLGAAISYLGAFDLEALARHEKSLTEAAYSRLSEIKGLRIVGPPPEGRGPILSFTVKGLHPHDLAELLDRRGVAVRAGHHCTMPLHDRLRLTATTRASFSLYNTHAEIDALVDAIENARRVFRLA
jgi:cysteine desulfurase/selenocysteine lyase